METNIILTSDDKLPAVRQYSTYIRNVLDGVPLPAGFTLQNWSKTDDALRKYIDYAYSNVLLVNKDLVSITPSMLPVVPPNPQPVLIEDSIGFRLATNTEIYTRPSTSNVQSCHAEEQSRRGAQLAYLSNPFWFQFSFYTARVGNQPMRANYTRLHNSKTAEETKLFNDLGKVAYPDQNLIATANAILMFTEQGYPIIAISRLYGNPNQDLMKLITYLSRLYPTCYVGLVGVSNGSWNNNNTFDSLSIPKNLDLSHSIQFKKTIAKNCKSLPMPLQMSNPCTPFLHRYPDIADPVAVRYSKGEDTYSMVQEQHPVWIVATPTAKLSKLYKLPTLQEAVGHIPGARIVEPPTKMESSVTSLSRVLRMLFKCAITGLQGNLNASFTTITHPITGEQVLVAKTVINGLKYGDIDYTVNGVTLFQTPNEFLAINKANNMISRYMVDECYYFVSLKNRSITPYSMYSVVIEGLGRTTIGMTVQPKTRKLHQALHLFKYRGSSTASVFGIHPDRVSITSPIRVQYDLEDIAPGTDYAVKIDIGDNGSIIASRADQLNTIVPRSTIVRYYKVGKTLVIIDGNPGISPTDTNTRLAELVQHSLTRYKGYTLKDQQSARIVQAMSLLIRLLNADKAEELFKDLPTEVAKLMENPERYNKALLGNGLITYEELNATVEQVLPLEVEGVVPA